MTVLSKQDIPRPVLPKETVPVPELGEDGEIIVQGVSLPEMVEIHDRGLSNAYRMMAMLAICVVDKEGAPIFSEKEWGIWGVQNRTAMVMLSDKVNAISGMGDREKKDVAPG